MALIDDITITVVAGNGGDGGRSFHQNYGTVKSTGDGGNGGRGGSIYFEGTPNLNDLSEFRFKKVIEAPDGVRGMNKNLDGRKGEDITVLVPLGTTIINTATEEAIEILEEKNPILIAKGGLGQSGNHDGKMPLTDEMPRAQLGEKKELHLVLNLIADIGLIGLPNAGKSSLLKTLTRADPKIGNYPFTTLEPNLGVLQLSENSLPVVSPSVSDELKTDKPNSENRKQKTDNRVVLADIPGLVEGASLGKGLGIQFLKHIQKTKILLHCIDGTQSEPFRTYQTVRKEFEDYDPTLLAKKEIILLTKLDLVEPEVLKKNLAELKKTKRRIIAVSIYDPRTMLNLKKIIIKECTR